MHRLLLLLLLGGCATFVHDASRVVPGTAIHYVKSNLDGTKPSLVTMYIIDGDDIEVSKSEKDVDDSADVRAHLDWRRFSADRLDAGVLTSDGKREARAELTLGERELAVKLGDTAETLPVSTFPLHVYNFDLMSLNMTLPHLARPRSGFRFAVAEPTFGQKPGVMELRGYADATYAGDETLHGVPTHKYRVSGAGMAGREGWLWINDADGYLEKFESPLANNPGWTSLRLERRGVSRMTQAEWSEYKRKNVGVGVR
jgi:hypothetical protein